MTKLLFIIIFSVFIFSPFVFVSAQDGPIVPCGTDICECTGDDCTCPKEGGGTVTNGQITNPCNFDKLITLVQNIINFLLLIAAPIAAVMFAYAGWLYLSAAGNQGQVEKAHKIFTAVFMGIVLALIAWLIINVISTTLLKPDFISIK